MIGAGLAALLVAALAWRAHGGQRGPADGVAALLASLLALAWLLAPPPPAVLPSPPGVLGPAGDALRTLAPGAWHPDAVDATGFLGAGLVALGLSAALARPPRRAGLALIAAGAGLPSLLVGLVRASPSLLALGLLAPALAVAWWSLERRA